MINLTRTTKETDVKLALNLDGDSQVDVQTGIGFFDHMLHALAFHAGWDLQLVCKGDLQVCPHHSVEDVGILLGTALAKALEDKSGLARYGTAFIPMDEAMAQSTVDLSGRPYLHFDASFVAPSVGAFDTQLCEEFFRALAIQAKITLHISVLYGVNDHHKIEAIFKSVAHALRAALMPRKGILSTKGVLS